MAKHRGSVRTTQRRLRVVDVPHPLRETIGRLVTILDDAAEQDGWGRPPALIRITEWPSDREGGFDLGIKPLDREANVVETLAGFDAPSDWAALGVITEGNARHLVDPEVEHRRVRCVHLVERGGASASSLRLQGDAPIVLDGQAQPEGRINDVCRRALGLTTPAPRHSSAELFAVQWLIRILEWWDADGAAVLWSDIATLHPAAAVLIADDDHWAREASTNLVRLGQRLAEIESWPVLRAACAAGDLPVADVPPYVAGWLDDGAFSRWVLGGYPPLHQMAMAVSELLPPSLRRRVFAVLREWELDWRPPT